MRKEMFGNLKLHMAYLGSERKTGGKVAKGLPENLV